MDKVTLIASASMGIESIVAQEIKDLGFENVQTFNGRVEFDGKLEDIPKANIWLRCADRVFLKMGEFEAFTFEELFENVKNLNWADVLTEDGEFPVSWVSSVGCKLYSKSDIQRISKKAIVEKMKEKYKKDYFSEDGAAYKIKVQGSKDKFIVMIDTSGDGLHKRGYRAEINEAPMKETLAAALVKISRWMGGELSLLDPMCGTGTILIEAAMIARNIAPGSNRKFAAEKWDIIEKNKWIDVRDNAYSCEDHEKEVKIYGSDIDGETIEIAKKNAVLAGIEDDILFETKHLLEVEQPSEYGAIITNPPYGERLLDDKAVNKLYGILGDVCRMRFPKWSYYVITSYEQFERAFEKKCTKNRKLYNGGIKCYLYQYFGTRPPKKNI
ncbi:class I SAM-dependent RNA methyltransferase [uncultured Ilyobacter sp.]|uniref:THUMP domain-containing class I SAM-dependent RNA methyltransferase n=1 Tax=uncultured Ilyobacter sp. TaxID=544433 RepID=UPI0029C7A216|nr:class I SAM-dependent RNA methyltransferase [uncultured Ilyobacter sp.]